MATALAVPGLLLLGGQGAFAARSPIPVGEAPVPDAPGAAVEAGLRRATGSVEVIVQLARPSLAASVAPNALQDGTLPSAAGQRSILASVADDQDAVASAARSLGATELARVSKSLNALVVKIDASRIPALADVPGVVSVRPVRTYETQAIAQESGSLEQAATYLQADPLRAAGIDGTGVRVAVLDSGVDYTHANLGGPGTAAFYEGCYGDVTDPFAAGPKDVAVAPPCDAYFGPGAPKVKGGYDFVGDSWPFADLAPDPNPLDYEGHGTHVSDIIAGNGVDHTGLAPGASLYALKVCSAVATSCSGVALLEAVDWAIDPNQDGDLSDAVDLMNLSLGSDYGGDEDDLSFALDNAVRVGVVVVASAGNGNDRPFKVGSPSTAAGVISVAQTAMPDDLSNVIEVTSPPAVPGLIDNKIKLTVLQPWGGPIPPTPGLIGDLARPSVSTLGCTTAAYGSAVVGKIALVNRGTCAISVKASNAQEAGAIGFILTNNTGGAPGAFSYGGGVIDIPTLAVSQSSGNALAAALAGGPVSVKVDPANAVPLVGTMVSSSSRGPSIDGIRVKPDIGAPGAWLSAEVGTGDGETNFGGTSGAAPTVSGVATLLLQQFPREAPSAIKTRLLNGADMGNTTPDLEANLYPTPISRIGAGEVRALPASTATFRLKRTGTGNLALGSLHLSANTTVERTVTIENLATTAQDITLSLNFRDPADQALGALAVTGTGLYNVAAKSKKDVTLAFTIRPGRLPAWPLTGTAGITGSDGTVLNGPELDGYLLATSATGEVKHLGWHVLPHRSSRAYGPSFINLRGLTETPLTLWNSTSALDGYAEVFSLTGTSPALPKPGPGDPGSPGSNIAQVDLRNVGVRDDGDVVQFAINGNDRRPTPLYPAGYAVEVDTNRDGTADYALSQGELGGFGASGQSVVYVRNLAANTSAPYYYAIADFDSANMVLTAPMAALGLAPGDSFDFSVYAYDNYFSGFTTDAIEGMTYTAGSPKFHVEDGGVPTSSIVIPAQGSTTLPVKLDPSGAPSTELGLLLLFDDAAQREAQAIIAVV